MSAGPVTVLDIAIDKLGKGGFNLSTDAFWVVLCTSSQLITPAFVGASVNAQYSDLTGQVVGTGYTAGGKALTGIGWTPLSGVSKFTANNVSWTVLTATMKYAMIIRKVGGTLTDILAYVDLETGDPAGRVAAAEDFVISWISGLFDVQRA